MKKLMAAVLTATVATGLLAGCSTGNGGNGEKGSEAAGKQEVTSDHTSIEWLQKINVSSMWRRPYVRGLIGMLRCMQRCKYSILDPC